MEDVNLMQITLLQRRLSEIDAEIKSDQERIKHWEERIAIFADNVLRQALVEKTAMMYERKGAIELQIRQRLLDMKSRQDKSAKTPTIDRILRHRRMSSFPLRKSSSTTNIPPQTNAQVARPEFLHRFVVHHLQVVWNTRIRNRLFKFLDSQDQTTAINFFLKTSAITALKQTVKAAKDKTASLQSSHQSSKSSTKKSSYDDLELESDPSTATMSQKIAQDLLEKLLAEKTTHYLVTENENETPTSPKHASNDPNDPAYVSPQFSIYNDYCVQFFYPQVCLETVTELSRPGCVLITAESAQLRSCSIMDESDGRPPKTLVKTRKNVGLEGTQFFSTFKSDILAKLGHRGLARTVEDIPWPAWVPIECLIDQSLPTEEFVRIVDRAEPTVQYDQCSTMYLPSQSKTHATTLLSDKPEGLDDHSSELEFVNSVFVNFPQLVVRASSAHYCAIHDVISNLLIYSDPERKQRQEQLDAVKLALGKEDLAAAVRMVEEMQSRIRSLNGLSRDNIAYAQKQHLMDETVHDGKFDLVQNEIMSRVQTSQQELLVIMDALKRIAYQLQHRDSVKKSMRIVVNSKKLAWELLLDSGDPCCDLALHGSSYYVLNHEDNSKLNTVEINKITMTNLLPRPYYRDMIGAYNPESRDINFHRHKMLRMYWREMAPVAGISIIDHFELNIHPLLLQLTYDVAKNLIEYFYPKKRKERAAQNEASQTSSSAASITRLSADVVSMQSGTPEPTLKPSRSFDHFSIRPRSVSARSEGLRRSASNDTGGFDDVASVESSGRTDSKRSALFGSQSSQFDLADDGDLRLMKDRASSNKTFVYIKVPGVTHCLSYHGKMEKNIEDLYQFVLRLPTLEYHNRTWTWLEFLMQVRKDIAMAVFAQTGSLVKEKLLRRRKHRPPKNFEKESADEEETRAPSSLADEIGDPGMDDQLRSNKHDSR